jgi:hypothetical protein
MGSFADRPGEATPYDQSAAKDAPGQERKLKPTHPITGLRLVRGFAAIRRDDIVGRIPKTIRRHFGRFYAVNVVRNKSCPVQDPERSGEERAYPLEERTLWKVAGEMERLSRRIFFQTLPDTRRRKCLTKKVLGLN